MSTFTRQICAGHDRLTAFSGQLGILTLLLILLMFCYEVSARYFFRAPTDWVSDFSGYALLVSTILLVPRIAADRGHIQITFLQNRLDRRAEHMVNAAIMAVSAATCIWAGWYAVDEALRQYDRGIRTLAVVSVPRWIFSAVLAYGFLSTAIHYIRHAVEHALAPAGGADGENNQAERVS